ncbi:MAG TPA: VanZ family protein [Thermoanaerobaculia bacterium]|jgi:VanZ family protein
MSPRVAIRLWLPPILWTIIIFAGSTGEFSSGQTEPWLATLINSIIGHQLSPSQFGAIHFLIRKGSHLTEYGILGALLFRAFRAERGGWNTRWALAAVAVAAAVGGLDEWHQVFVPSRTASVSDVLFDAASAALAQMLFFRR